MTISFFRIFILVLFLPLLGKGQAIIRGPYLQKPTQHSITIKWRTDQPLSSIISWGGSPGNYQGTFTNYIPKTNHTVTIGGLDEGQVYYYQIGDPASPLTPSSTKYRFATHPESSFDGLTKIWVLGDFGTGGTTQGQVRDAYLSYSAQMSVNMWLWLGDNAYNTGQDAEFQSKVFSGPMGYEQILPNLPFYPIPGNHDYYGCNTSGSPSQHTGPYYDIVDVYTHGEAGGVPSGMEAYYSFDYGDIHFVMLNSEIASSISDTLSEFGIWLKQDLMSCTKKWKIVAIHRPPHTKGSHNSDGNGEPILGQIRRLICPILERFGVDLIMSGHSHNYERSFFMNGFFGESTAWSANTYVVQTGNGDRQNPYTKPTQGFGANRGTVYVVCGNGGQVSSGLSLNHPAMCKVDGAGGQAGFLMLSIEGNDLVCQYIRSTGEVYDEFQISKTSHTDIEEPKQAILSVSPNPVGQIFRIKTDRKYIGQRLVIYDLNGAVVHTSFIQENELVLDAAEIGLVSGTYNAWVLDKSSLVAGLRFVVY